MTDISELEQRITAALDRIGAGLDGLAAGAAAPAADEGELAELREALEAERVANAQLEERVRALHDQQDKRIGEVQAELEALRGDAEAANAGAVEARNEVASLRRMNEHLQAAIGTLREAAANGVIEPQLINHAMQTEIEGLRSVRDADRRELNEILGALEPQLEGAGNA